MNSSEFEVMVTIVASMMMVAAFVTGDNDGKWMKMLMAGIKPDGELGMSNGQ